MTINYLMEQVLSKLNIASTAGDAESANGAKLIGHRPDVAPRAFVHVLYKGLEDEELDILESRLGTNLPVYLRTFYKCCNGMMIYLGRLRFLGYVPLDAENVGVHNFPSNIVTPNLSARLKGLSPKDLVFAWYKTDGSYAVLEDSGHVCRYDVMNGGGLLECWTNFEGWLLSEIDRLQSDFI